MKTAMFLAVLGIFLVMAMPPASAYEIVGDYVIEDDNRATIMAWPHTVTGPWDKVNIMIKSKIYEGPIDVVFGFNSDIALPKTGEYLKNDTWIDVSDKFTSVAVDYQGFDRWYYFKGFNVIADEEYNVRMSLNFIEPGDGKYWVCIKPSGDTFQEAISSGRFMCLDPWFSSSYINRRLINSTCNDCTGNVSFMMPVNRTSTMDIAGSLELFWCNITSNSTDSYVYYNDATDYICADSDQKILIIDEGNGTKFSDLEDNIVMWLDMGSNNCNTTACLDMSIYSKTYIKKGANEPILDSNGIIGSCQSFDGANDFIRLDDDAFWNSAFPDNGPIYIGMWVRPQDLSVITYPISRSSHFIVTIDQNGKPIITYWYDASNRAPISGSNGDVVADEFIWFEFSHTGIGNQGTIYINLVNVTATQVTSANAKLTNEPTQLGAFIANFDNSLIDFTIVMNRTPTDDERAFLYDMTNRSGSLGGEEIEDFVIKIISPTNITYTNESVSLLYSLNFGDDSTCVSSQYSISGSSNISLGCMNSTITFNESLGKLQTLTIHSTNNNGSTRSASVTYSVVFGGNFTVRIFDEMDGTSFNTSDMILTSFCSNDTETLTLTNWTSPNTILNCTPNFIQLNITDSSNRSTVRSLIPITTSGNLDFYMINQSKNNQIDQTWQIYDISGIYDNGIIQIAKVIPSIGAKTISQQRIDAEDKVFMDLILGEIYTITIFDSDRSNERIIGGVQTTTDTTTNIEVSTVTFQTDSRIPARDVFVSFSQDKDLQFIRVLYNDTLGETTSVNFTVVNASNISQIMFTSISTSSVVTFTYNNVDTNTTYIATVTAIHTRYGTLVETKTISFSETGLYTVDGLEATGNGIWMAVAAGMIILFVTLSFSKRNAKFGLVTATLMIAMFMFFGWFVETPAVGWAMITLLVIIATIAIISLGRRFN